MSRYRRNNDYTAFYTILIILFFGIAIAIKFLMEVHKHRMWKECAISIGVLTLISIINAILLDANIINNTCFTIQMIVSFIIFCIYWCKQFGYIP